MKPFVRCTVVYLVCVFLALVLMLIPYCWHDGYYAHTGSSSELEYVDLGFNSYFDPTFNYFSLLTAYGTVVLIFLTLLLGTNPESCVKSGVLGLLSILLAISSCASVAVDPDNVTIIGYFIAALLTVCAVCRAWMFIQNLLKRKRKTEDSSC